MGLDKNFNTAGANEMELAGGGLTSATLSNCLKEGKPLADTGELYSTIQDAENAASSWVFVPPGTFNETLTITTPNLTVVGAGSNSEITDSPGIDLQASGVTIRSLRVDPGSTNNGITDINSSGLSNLLLKSVRFGPDANEYIELINTSKVRVVNCHTTGVTSSSGVRSDDAQHQFHANIFTGENDIKVNSSESVYSCNIVEGDYACFDHQSGDDSVFIGNRMYSGSNKGIQIRSGVNDDIVANNRISDSGANIDDRGTGTITDGNLTGSAN